jgi:hypothetical protein
MSNGKHEIWELWYPKAAAAGLSFSRSLIDGAEDTPGPCRSTSFDCHGER